MIPAEVLEIIQKMPKEFREYFFHFTKVLYKDMVEIARKSDFEALKKNITELSKIVKELAAAQSKTEAKLEELAVKTEKRLEELAAAQSKTEDSLNKLINEHVETRRRLESMSDAVGYNLENQAYKALPALLQKDLKIKVEGKLVRRYFPGTRKGRYIQVNIYGWGSQNGKRILILGECKTSLSKKEVDRFLKLTKYIVKLENISEEETLKIAVVHDILPPVVSYLESKGIKLYWSYDL